MNSGPIGLCQNAWAKARGWSHSRSTEGVAFSIPQLPRGQAALLRTPAAGVAVAAELTPSPGAGRAQRQPKDGFSRFGWAPATGGHHAARRSSAANAGRRPAPRAGRLRQRGSFALLEATTSTQVAARLGTLLLLVDAERADPIRMGGLPDVRQQRVQVRGSAPVAPTHRTDTPTRPDRAGERC